MDFIQPLCRLSGLQSRYELGIQREWERERDSEYRTIPQLRSSSCLVARSDAEAGKSWIELQYEDLCGWNYMRRKLFDLDLPGD